MRDSSEWLPARATERAVRLSSTGGVGARGRDPDGGSPPPRAALLRAALDLSYFTIFWNGLVGGLALVLALFGGSLVLAGFALNALLDSSASAALVWRFGHERRDPAAADRAERRAQRLVEVAMALVALYVGAQSIRALVDGSHSAKPWLGLGIALVSLLVLPHLARRKFAVASALPSRALRGDAVLTSAGAALAGITLLALALSAGLGWWWADPTAALVIATALAAESIRIAIRHRFG